MEFHRHYNISINDLKDFVTIIFILVDDLYNESIPNEIRNRLHKEKAKMSDSEIITIAIIGEIMSIDSENAWLAYVRKNMRDLFPRMCERSRFNRLRRNLSSVSNQIRMKLGSKLSFTEDEYRIIDSFPLEVCEFGRAKFCKSFKHESADYGYCASKKKTYFGYKVHALCTLNGYITDFIVTPASIDDREAVWELTEKYQQQIRLIGDKGFISATLSQELLDERGIFMISMKRNNAISPEPKQVRQLFFKARKRIETSFSQLEDQFKTEYVRAKSLWGLTSRLQSKILAYNLCFAINWLNGKTNDIAHIKQLIY